MRSRVEAGFVAAVVLLGSAAAFVFLKLWDADLRYPFSYSGDGTLNLMLIKNAMERLWFYENPQLGAPNEQQLYDYPVVSGDGLHVLFFWVGGWFTDSPAVVMNVFFLLTFPLTALTAYLVLRRLAIGPDVALVMALLYTLLPYHFFRGETHLFLAAYYVVPLGAYLALSVLDGRAFSCRAGARGGADRGRLGVVLLLGVHRPVRASWLRCSRFLLARERGALVSGGLVVAVITAVSLVQLAPTIVYRVKHGTNDEVAKRYWFESESYGLRITQLVLPVDGHRIDALASRKAEYLEQIPRSEGTAATLGVVGTVGFLWLLGVAVAACAGLGRRWELGRYRGLAVLTVVAVLIGTIGGLSTLIAVVWPQIRAWNRLSVFIAFFALLAVALLLESLRRRVPRRRRSSPCWWRCWPSAPSIRRTTRWCRRTPAWRRTTARTRTGSIRWSRSSGRARWSSSCRTSRSPSRRSGIVRCYEPAKPYVHSSDLRWSYGAMRGRPEDWAAEHATKPAAELVPAARDAGFAGIMVDRLAYLDQGAAASADLGAALGSDPETSRNGRYLFWPL